MKTLISLGSSLVLSQLSFATDVEPLTYEGDLFSLTPDAVASKFTEYNWSGNITEKQGLTLFGQEIDNLELTESKDFVNGLSVKLIADGALHSKTSFNKKYLAWGKLLQEKIPKKGKKMPSHSSKGILSSRFAWNFDNTIVVLSKREGKKTPVELALNFYPKDVGLAHLRDRGDLKSIGPTRTSNTPTKPKPREPSARGEKGEIKKMIREIMARKAPDGISKKNHDAINLLNVYRYLSGVSYKIKGTKDLHAKALKAAIACRKHGGLSHDLGHYTDKSNLAMSTAGLTMAKSVTQYIDDAGDNNRERRGHRRWCFNHTMGKAGFGIDGAYSAMYCFDMSGRATRKNYGYPGVGYYPIKYVHGNSWSYYLVDGDMPGNVKVEVYKLDKEVTKAPRWSDKVDGEPLPVPYVNAFKNTVNFEPQSTQVTKKGCYLVRLKGKSFKEQYIVNLF